jgi:hypothetical protein
VSLLLTKLNSTAACRSPCSYTTPGFADEPSRSSAGLSSNRFAEIRPRSHGRRGVRAVHQTDQARSFGLGRKARALGCTPSGHRGRARVPLSPGRSAAGQLGEAVPLLDRPLTIWFMWSAGVVVPCSQCSPQAIASTWLGTTPSPCIPSAAAALITVTSLRCTALGGLVSVHLRRSGSQEDVDGHRLCRRSATALVRAQPSRAADHRRFRRWLP